MFSTNDIALIKLKGINPLVVEKQIENFKNGFPFMQLLAPATIQHGIRRLTEDEVNAYSQNYESIIKGREVLKFVPASGAASRMFKSLFEFIDEISASPKDVDLLKDKGFNSPAYFFDNIKEFAFYEELKEALEKDGLQLDELVMSGKFLEVLKKLLDSDGLNYANLPKALLRFHRYSDESGRTALEEHLVEAANYACNDQGMASVHFTVSPEHVDDFKKLVDKVQAVYEERFGVRYEIEYSIQKPSTDTIAVDLNNNPFRETDGSLLFRPGGHGALIENLNDLNADIVFIKNIDNIVPDRLKETTYLYKKAIVSMLVELQTEVFGMLQALENPDIRKERIYDFSVFCNEMLNIRLPDNFKQLKDEEQIEILKKVLNRPIRICGMVKNEGEPGGGPFWVKDVEGKILLQIVESSQINLADESQLKIMQASTHFNPVDLVCGLKNYRGHNFNLPDFVDPSTGFIAEKSKDGRKLKAQELPGLWNGAMADWITIFVETPIITFNPVKVINDLLRKEHLM
ncbi:MAG: DUF4301 family protein [Bacteroidales bacterium]|jgi:hypothetical protein|nr:DUF4301 family protein [Bacteroidales bacterium]